MKWQTATETAQGAGTRLDFCSRTSSRPPTHRQHCFVIYFVSDSFSKVKCRPRTEINLLLMRRHCINKALGSSRFSGLVFSRFSVFLFFFWEIATLRAPKELGAQIHSTSHAKHARLPWALFSLINWYFRTLSRGSDIYLGPCLIQLTFIFCLVRQYANGKTVH